MFFENLQSLFRHVLEKDRVLVYGDLGRLPHVVVDFLSSHYAHLRIYFVSTLYPVSIPNYVRQFRKIEPRSAQRAKCDLLVLLEPLDHAIFEACYSGSGSVVAFTSHAILDARAVDSLDVAAFFFRSEDRVDRIRQLTAKLEGSEENDDVQLSKNHVAHSRVITVGPESHCDAVTSAGRPAAPPESEVFAIVDLTSETRPVSIFLRYLDAFDYMTEHLDRVDRWSVSFSVGGERKFDNFVQECIDRLHCTPNIRPHLRELLPLLPFYKSGTIDNGEEVPVSRMVRREYVAPESLDEAFTAAIAHDTERLVGGVLSII